MCDTNPAALKTMLWSTRVASAAAAAAAQTRRSARARPSLTPPGRSALLLRGDGERRGRDQREIRVRLILRRHRAGRRDAEPHVVAQLAASLDAQECDQPSPRRTSTAPACRGSPSCRSRQRAASAAARAGRTPHDGRRSCPRRRGRRRRARRAPSAPTPPASGRAGPPTTPRFRRAGSPGRSARSKADTGTASTA